MSKRGKISFGDKRIAFAALALLVFGSLMIASAEMGNSAGDASYLTGVITRQLIYGAAGLVAYFFLMNFPAQNIRLFLAWVFYFGIMAALIACRFFGQINGAYAWIWIGSGATIQPSEFAKVFMIIFACRLLGRDQKEKNTSRFWTYAAATLVYTFIILVIQHDLGSAVVLFVMCYCMAMLAPYKELKKHRRWMTLIVLGVVALALIVLSPPVTELLKKHADNYMVGRFLAAADPFLYQYDNGYHIIMSLVSFANGGLFGLGYGNSIHKYMNFPNPSNDFILPVIVEELGIVGFVGLLVLYGLLLYPIISASLRAQRTVSKMALLGVFMYFILHFILNVGGVSGLIPLTGVPLLMISSGGSSLMASMASLGLAQNELVRIRKENDAEDHRG
ncbi:MAG: FtsW/RodA/SpoVE family cell cycle protein [Erysipelotrichaceae bacterium]|nr:FtsW/RodA/SpoVE family cell cycle protein [Erysipelotrichaceae bacterium]